MNGATFIRCQNCLAAIPADSIQGSRAVCVHCGGVMLVTARPAVAGAPVHIESLPPGLDGKIYDLLLARFRKESKLDLAGDANALERVREAALRAAQTLKTEAEATVNLPFITATPKGPVHLVATVTRAEVGA